VKADEYLESVFKEAFKRELEVDENVARTLPFFAATLALVVTLYGYATTKLPAFEPGFLSLLLHLLLIAGAACLAGVVYSLFQAVRVREYRIPPKETEQIAWAESLKSFYAEQGMNPAAADHRVASDLRARMLVEFAEGVEHNRAANAPKLKARAQGFTLLVAALGIAPERRPATFNVRLCSASAKPTPSHQRKRPCGTPAEPRAVKYGSTPKVTSTSTGAPISTKSSPTRSRSSSTTSP